MTEPTPEPTETPEPEQQQSAEPADQVKMMTTKFEAERRLRKKFEKELVELRNNALTESEKAIEEARSTGRREGAKSAGVRLVAAEFRAKAAEAKLPGVTSLLEVIDLTRFVDDDGEPDTELIQSAIDKISDSLAAVENGKPKAKAPEIPKGVRPKVGDDDFIRTILGQED
jgi:uncharacterized protein YbjT (DUF2867 family)